MNEIKLQSNKKKKNEKLHKHRDERDWTKTSLDNLVVVLFPYDLKNCILYSYLLALPNGVNKYEIIVSFSSKYPENRKI